MSEWQPEDSTRGPAKEQGHDPGDDLESRVARLEATVRELQAQLPEGQRPRRRPIRPILRPESMGSDGRGDAAADGGAARPDGRDTPVDPHRGISTERWLAGAGITFVVLALAFLLKLSFDRGWVTPALRLIFGGVAGLGLLVAGLRLTSTRRPLSQFLLGGAVSVFYLVGYAGAELYALIPYWVALSLMSTNTLLAMVLSEREKSSHLAVLGTLGGLATPFLLDSANGTPSGLAAYLILIILGAGAVQLHRGWPVLLGVLTLGGGMALAALATAVGSAPVLLPLAALTAYWIVTVASPLVRPSIEGIAQPSAPASAVWIARLAAGWGTLMFVTQTSSVLDLERVWFGGLWLMVAAVLALLARFVLDRPNTAAPAAEIASFAGAIGITATLWSPLAIVVVLGEVALLLALSAPATLPTLVPVAHTLAIFAGIGLVMNGFYLSMDGAPGFRDGAFTRLSALAVAAITGSLAGRHGAIYRFAAYAGLLFWSLTELASLPNGEALVSIAWAAQGAVALIWAIRIDAMSLRNAGLATLALVAAKLLLVDLSQLDPVWRILLFLGFGAALLGLGYLINRGGPEEGAPVDPGAGP